MKTHPVTAQAGKAGGRMVALDGLRAVAVGAVLVEHYFPGDSFIQFLPWGSLGVQLFFVISGFLITGILLDLRTDGGPPVTGAALRVFYMRRFLRIFPPYYALLLACAAAGVSFPHGAAWACPLYVFNFLPLYVDDPFPYLGHLWTLCIEEQFYLVWPLVVLAVSRRLLVPVAVALVIAAPVFRIALAYMGISWDAIRGLPLSQFDALAGGALLAMLRWDGGAARVAAWERLRWWVAVGGVALYFGCRNLPFAHWKEMLATTGSAMVMAVVVDWVAHGGDGRARRLLALPPLVYVGKISYGIYLYQFVTLFLLYKLQKILGHPGVLQNPLGFAAGWTALTLLVAACSWHFFERPLTGLKRHFPYHG